MLALVASFHVIAVMSNARRTAASHAGDTCTHQGKTHDALGCLSLIQGKPACHQGDQQVMTHMAGQLRHSIVSRLGNWEPNSTSPVASAFRLTKPYVLSRQVVKMQSVVPMLDAYDVSHKNWRKQLQ